MKIVPQGRRGLSTVEAELEVERSKKAALEAKINDLSTHVQLSQSKQVELEVKLDFWLSQAN
jgi:outer membrane murein-binding lipoprotein Lpp